jgi:predicted metal-dependent phosphoesterase TrpH
MPRHQPFTHLCQQAARLARPAIVDLHVHTTASDGDFTPSQVVAFARLAGLSAVAITDHDTTAGLAEAEAAAADVTVVPGVEISAESGGTEYHILGYFISPGDGRLAAALEAVRSARRARFRHYLDRLTDQRVAFPAGMVEATEAAASSLGRRHVAKLLVGVGAASTTAEAFRRFLNPVPTTVCHCLPLKEALTVITGAGGVASLAHPSAGLTQSDLAALRDRGLHAVEAHFSAATAGRTRELREWVRILGMPVTGGSDFHGRTPAGRGIGSPGLPAADFAGLCEFAGCPV